MYSNVNQSEASSTDKNSTIQMSNSLVNMQINERSHSIPSLEENTSRFLVGSYTSNNSFLHTITYDSEKNDLKINEVINFDQSEKDEKIINEISGIYSSINLEESGNIYHIQDMNYYVQVFNESDRKYQLKFINNLDKLDEITYHGINSCQSDHIFDNGDSASNNKLYLISHNSITEIDTFIDKINNNIEFIKFSEEENENHPIKICSDGSKFDPKQVAIGINETLCFVDLNSNKLISKVENAHYNGILSCEFDPFNSFFLSTGGMDYSIKYWDVRKLSNPLATITNNSHWIWDLKYNKHFSRVMIHASSSSIVRGIISAFKESEDINNMHDKTNNSARTLIDYVEFEDSVYSLDWSLNDPWIFAAVSFNSFVHINSIPEDIKYQVMLDN